MMASIFPQGQQYFLAYAVFFGPTITIHIGTESLQRKGLRDPPPNATIPLQEIAGLMKGF